jgi:cytochrome c5
LVAAKNGGITSAQGGNPDSWYALYILHVNSRIAPQDVPKTLDYLVKAAAAGNKGAEENLRTIAIVLRGLDPIAKLDHELLSESIKSSDGIDLQLGKKIYMEACAVCHATGIVGSPRANQRQEWEERTKQGFEVLVQHAVYGFTGKTGLMPPKGGAVRLHDAEVAAAVAYMTSF